MKLIKNIQVYAPEDLGVKDVLISDSKIEKIDDHITYPYSIETIDGSGCILTPGLIDRHVHITGGGGEAGFILVQDLLKSVKYSMQVLPQL